MTLFEDSPAPPRRDPQGRRPTALVVGAGLGGLAAAISLAHKGHRVVVLEAASQPGGKAGTVTVDGVTVDTGPSMFTLPHVLEPLLQAGGRQLGRDLRLLQPEPAFRYRYVDGTVLDLHHDLGETADSVGAALGSAARDELLGFLSYTRKIWDTAAPRFVFGPAPGWRTILSYGLSALFELPAIDPLRSMQRAIKAQVSSPHLRMLFARFATYNGSDVRRAPATLNCIAHVELSLGGYGIDGGVHALVELLVDIARGLGVELWLDAPVRSVDLDAGRVSGVTLVDGTALVAPVVVCNADAAWLRTALPAGTPHGLPKPPVGSMSGWNAIVRARRREDRPAHEVFFCRDYDQEFADIFDRDRPPVEPTLYLCAQEVAHGRAGWANEEPVFLMVNAPSEPPGRARPAAVWEAVQQTALDRAQNAGIFDVDDEVVWTRTPADLARRFPGSNGGLYGAASNDAFAAFRRPPNRIDSVPGLFLATGSAHPGGGMPLAVRSGLAATEAVLAASAPVPA